MMLVWICGLPLCNSDTPEDLPYIIGSYAVLTIPFMGTTQEQLVSLLVIASMSSNLTDDEYYSSLQSIRCIYGPHDLGRSGKLQLEGLLVSLVADGKQGATVESQCAVDALAEATQTTLSFNLVYARTETNVYNRGAEAVGFSDTVDPQEATSLVQSFLRHAPQVGFFMNTSLFLDSVSNSLFHV
ncbi:hypothetical protein A0H81_02002 [Grifola frondosa]|uniref:Uncharacterized protein n=1 Tax=Grifola frondosa TaxID=5627 RepID=A0A1C7MNQ1_GRIFR|nr:hypothetical protein A0H81_02002 [Grifola frondosa]